ncbi:MAG: hypothetical protein SGPRY_012855 [Prymnesium sp.]
MLAEERLLYEGVGYDASRGKYTSPSAHLVREALAARVNLNCRDPKGNSALGHAAWHGEEEVLLLLLKAGAELEAENLEEATPLQMAVLNNKPYSAALLLVSGAEHSEAMEDAESMGRANLLALFNAWDHGLSHSLLVRAQKQIIHVRQSALREVTSQPILQLDTAKLRAEIERAAIAQIPAHLISDAREHLLLAEREQLTDEIAKASKSSYLGVNASELTHKLRHAVEMGIDGFTVQGGQQMRWRSLMHRAVAADGIACDFILMDAQLLRHHAENRFLSLQELSETHPDWLSTHTIWLSQACRGKYTSKFLAVSHREEVEDVGKYKGECESEGENAVEDAVRWESEQHPDPNGAQYEALLEHLKQRPQIKWVWYDYCSLRPDRLAASKDALLSPEARTQRTDCIAALELREDDWHPLPRSLHGAKSNEQSPLLKVAAMDVGQLSKVLAGINTKVARAWGCVASSRKGLRQSLGGASQVSADGAAGGDKGGWLDPVRRMLCLAVDQISALEMRNCELEEELASRVAPAKIRLTASQACGQA